MPRLLGTESSLEPLRLFLSLGAGLRVEDRGPVPCGWATETLFPFSLCVHSRSSQTSPVERAMKGIRAEDICRALCKPSETLRQLNQKSFKLEWFSEGKVFQFMSKKYQMESKHDLSQRPLPHKAHGTLAAGDWVVVAWYQPRRPARTSSRT